jgi:hypothetical protein
MNKRGSVAELLFDQPGKDDDGLVGSLLASLDTIEDDLASSLGTTGSSVDTYA